MATSASRGTATDRRTVIGVFDGPSHAEQALNGLKNAGFSPEQVSVVAKESGETRTMVENTGMGAENAGKGALGGAVAGGLLGWLVGVSALVIPGIGPIVGAGILASTLAGAGIGAAAGGLLGALTGMGVPEDEARGYEDSVRKGSILLSAHANSDQQAMEARQIFDRYGGGDVRAYGVGAQGGTSTRVGMADATTGGASAITGASTTGASTVGTSTTGTSGAAGTGSGAERTVITSDELRDSGGRGRRES